MIVGEAPGADEERLGEPFVGVAGQELSKMLNEAGILRSECYLTNVCKYRPPHNDISSWFFDKKNKTPGPQIQQGLAELKAEIGTVNPTVIIALGDTALWALTGHHGITAWRGSILPCTLLAGYKVIPTLHPANVLRAWSGRALVLHDLRRAVAESTFKEIKLPPYEFATRPTFETAQGTLRNLLTLIANSPLQLSVDIETRRGLIACVGIAWSRHHAICIPLMCVERINGYWKDTQEELTIMLLLKELLTHPNARVVGQNFLYDAQYFAKHLGFVPRLTDDTMFQQHVAFAGLPKDLGFLSSLYCDFHQYWKEEGKTWEENTSEDQLWVYNCKDAVTTLEICEKLREAITALGFNEVYAFQMQLWHLALDTMLRGIRVDRSARNVLAVELIEASALRSQFLTDVIGYELNPRSSKQMHKFLYEELRLPPVYNKTTKNVTANYEALVKLSAKEPLLLPIADALLEQRSLGVFLSTFIQAQLDTDGRVRCSFNPAGTETYRFSSSKDAFNSGMNLQNLPKGTSPRKREIRLEMPNIRELFVPDPGYTFFDIDLDRADLQVVIAEAEDAELRQMLREGVDLHVENAKTLFGKTAISKVEREVAKTFTHGTNYGGRPRTMAATCGVTVHQAEHMQSRWFEAHPGIMQWHQRTLDLLMTKRCVMNKFGYRRFYFDRIEALLPEALAWVPQSTVACVINRVWKNIDDLKTEIQILLQVHDSLAGQYPTHLDAVLIPKLHAATHITIPYPDPLTIPVGLKTSTTSWGDCKERSWSV